MQRIIHCCLIFGAILFISSCSTKQYQVLFQQKSSLNENFPAADSVPEYRIKSQDILQVRNLQDSKYLVTSPSATNTQATNVLEGDSHNQDYQVQDDGTVILPVIGHIKVAGYTRAEAERAVDTAYRKSLYVNPIIELKIVNLKVTLFGEVHSQGVIPLTKERTKLIEVIGAAGGLTEKANESNVQIIRGSQKNPQVIVVDMGDIKSINDPRAVLQNGDIIYVSQNKRAVRTDNLQNFSTFYQPGIILLNTALILITLFRR